MTVAALYARISEDPLGLEEGVTRQLEDTRALAESRGWTVAGEYVDNDVSALRGKPRPNYTALMKQAQAGGIDQIVAYSMSRLWRNRTERSHAIDALSAAGVGIAAVKGLDLDLSDATGRMLAGVLGEVDTHESEVKAERVARAAQQRAEAGRANGSVSFGWRRERDLDSRGRALSFRDVVDDAQAAVVVEIVDRLLAGDSLKELRDDLNARGILSPYGKLWGTSSVRKIALRESNAGNRVYRGRVIGPAAWPALVDGGKHERVKSLLQDPARRTSRNGQRRHVLSFGAGACGVCGSRLRVVSRNGSAMYVCDAATGCVGRRQDRVDDLVAAVVAARLARPDAIESLRSRDPGGLGAAQAVVDTVRSRLDLAADDYAVGAIDGEQLRRISAALRPQLHAAEQSVRALTGPALDPLVDLVGDQSDADEIEARWLQLPVTRRHAVLQVLECRVRILPTRQGPGFNPADIEITFGAEGRGTAVATPTRKSPA